MPAQHFRIVFAAAVLMVASVQAFHATAAQADRTPDQTVTQPPEGIPVDRYIVVFRRNVPNAAAAASEMAARHGLQVRHVYAHALNGFSAVIPAARLAAIANDPRVQRVEREEAQYIIQQNLPTGVDRIEADLNTTVRAAGAFGIRIAVIDTGIDGSHPDLNVEGGMNFTGGGPGSWADGNGHGTHVAGTIGARGAGVVGVAPGTPVWAVKVCKNGGMCMTGDMVAGINWVAQKKQDFKAGRSGGIDFAAANMSISTRDESRSCQENANPDAVQLAICGVVNEGVVFVLAAGNEGRRKDAYPETLAVAAITDFDGAAGGAGAPTCRSDVDDRLASFSNFGVHIAAPGTCIRSTWKDGGYSTISGTSMAAPHAAGAVALYLHANGAQPATNRAGADAIRNALITAAHPEGTKGTTSHRCSYDNQRGTGEPLLYVAGTAFKGTNQCAVAGEASVAVDIAVTGISVPSSVNQGTVASVQVTIANVGTQSVSGSISVSVTDTPPSGGTAGSVSPAQAISGLAAGASQTLTFSWNTTNASAGVHTLTATHALTDDNALNNSRSATSQVKTKGGPKR